MKKITNILLSILLVFSSVITIYAEDEKGISSDLQTNEESSLSDSNIKEINSTEDLKEVPDYIIENDSLGRLVLKSDDLDFLRALAIMNDGVDNLLSSIYLNVEDGSGLMANIDGIVDLILDEENKQIIFDKYILRMLISENGEITFYINAYGYKNSVKTVEDIIVRTEYLKDDVYAYYSWNYGLTIECDNSDWINKIKRVEIYNSYEEYDNRDSGLIFEGDEITYANYYILLGYDKYINDDTVIVVYAKGYDSYTYFVEVIEDIPIVLNVEISTDEMKISCDDNQFLESIIEKGSISFYKYGEYASGNAGYYIDASGNAIVKPITSGNAYSYTDRKYDASGNAINAGSDEWVYSSAKLVNASGNAIYEASSNAYFDASGNYQGGANLIASIKGSNEDIYLDEYSLHIPVKVLRENGIYAGEYLVIIESKGYLQASYKLKVNELYKVEYVLNGGVMNYAYQSYYDNNESLVLYEPVKEGYIFDGWYLDAGFAGQKIVELLPGYGKDVKLYAKWKKDIEIDPFIMVDSLVEIPNYYVSLRESVSFHFDVEIDEEYLDYTTLHYVVGGKEYTVDDLDENYQLDVELNAKQMDETITVWASIGDVDGSEIEVSINDYCEEIINEYEGTVTGEMARALKEYGEYATYYFNQVNGIEELSTTKDFSEYKYMFADRSGRKTIKFTSVSLVLDSKISIKVYFKLAKDVDLQDITFEINDGDCQDYEIGENYIEINNISPLDYFENYCISAYDSEGKVISLYYSPMSYAQQALATTDEERINLRNLMIKLYEYGYAAESYVR